MDKGKFVGTAEERDSKSAEEDLRSSTAGYADEEMEDRFLEAAITGDYAGVREATKGHLAWLKNVPVGSEDDFRLQGLRRAAEKRHDKVVELILNKCPQTLWRRLVDNVEQHLEITLLHIAAWTGQAKEVERLRNDELGPDVNARTKGGITPLHMASFRGHLETVNALLAWPKVELRAETDKERFTALHMAADGGHAQVVKTLISACRDLQGEPSAPAPSQGFINATDCFHRTALHYACRNGRGAAVKVLLADPGIDVNPVDGIANFTPLHLACWAPGDHAEVVKLLMDAKVPVNTRIGVCHWDEAAVKELEEVGWKLLRPRLLDATVHSSMDLKRQGFPKKGDTPLHLAAEVGNVGVVTNLLRHASVQVNAREEQYGMTALHTAAMWGTNPALLTQLLEDERIQPLIKPSRGLRFYPDKYAQCEGMNVMHIAAYRGQPDMVKVLVSHSKTAGLLNNKTGECHFLLNGHYYRGLTCLHIVAYFGNEHACRVLLGQANVTTVNLGADFHILMNAENCRVKGKTQDGTVMLDQAQAEPLGNSQDCTGIPDQPQDKPLASLQDDTVIPQVLPLEHASAYKEHLKLVSQMLSDLGIDKARVDGIVTELKDPHTTSVGPPVHKCLRNIASANPSTEAKALIKELCSFMDDGYKKKRNMPAEFRDLEHADRCYSKMTPLHIAAHRGQLQVLTQILDHPAVEHNAQTSTGDTVLHIAIHERRATIVEALCAQVKIRAVVKNYEDKTALWMVHRVLEGNRELLEDCPDQKGYHIERDYQDKVVQTWREVKDSVETTKDACTLIDALSTEKQGFMDAANALIVGATLIASVTFGGFLQPPIGSAFDSYRGWAVRTFWSFNTLSFFFAVCTLVMSIRIVTPKPPQFIVFVLQKVRTDVAFTSWTLTLSTVFVIGAFVMAGLGNLPPDTLGSMLLSTVLGVMLIIYFAVLRPLDGWFRHCWKYRWKVWTGLVERCALLEERTQKEPRQEKPKWNRREQQAVWQTPVNRPRMPPHPHASLPSRHDPSIFSYTV